MSEECNCWEINIREDSQLYYLVELTGFSYFVVATKERLEFKTNLKRDVLCQAILPRYTATVMVVVYMVPCYGTCDISEIVCFMISCHNKILSNLTKQTKKNILSWNSDCLLRRQFLCASRCFNDIFAPSIKCFINCWMFQMSIHKPCVCHSCRKL